MIIDWDAFEADVAYTESKVPAMGASYRLGRGPCGVQLGQMPCVKVHGSDDPVHVAAHKDYGVIAVWSDEGGPPQINFRLYERVGPMGMCYLFGSVDPGTMVLIKPREAA